MNTRLIMPPLLAALLLCAGCSNLPGRPTPTSIPIDPDNVIDFDFSTTRTAPAATAPKRKVARRSRLAIPSISPSPTTRRFTK